MTACRTILTKKVDRKLKNSIAAYTTIYVENGKMNFRDPVGYPKKMDDPILLSHVARLNCSKTIYWGILSETWSMLKVDPDCWMYFMQSKIDYRRIITLLRIPTTRFICSITNSSASEMSSRRTWSKSDLCPLTKSSTSRTILFFTCYINPNINDIFWNALKRTLKK